MNYIDDVKALIADTLQIHDKISGFDASTPLLGHIPELDSMAVVGIMTGIEEHFGIVIEDDEVSADTFESLGSLVSFVEKKMGG